MRFVLLVIFHKDFKIKTTKYTNRTKQLQHRQQIKTILQANHRSCTCSNQFP